MYVGGGLGSVAYQAKLFDSFLAPEELLPTAQAMARVFARLGEKKNRNRARIKFLINDLGIEKFRQLVLEERKTLPHDPRWTQLISDAEKEREEPLRPAGELPQGGSESFQQWLRSNIRPQRQQGYVVATVALPLGDITALQLRALADVVRRFTRGTVRTTVEQNFVIRWVSRSDLPELHRALEAASLGRPGAGSIIDVVACPGTDTCKLGISSSRGLAAELEKRLAQKSMEFDESVRNLHIKISGCFNSCGQHHVADLGFYGVSRKIAGYAVPHFQVVLGGEWTRNAASYGLPILAIPSKRIPETVERITERFLSDRQKDESFQKFVKRIGKLELKRMLEDLAVPPTDTADRSFFRDWGDPREYGLGDLGIGECAGEVITAVEFDLAAAEREVFEAQVALEGGQTENANKTAYQSMLRAARALVKIEHQDVPEDADQIIREFRARYYDTRKFFDPYAGGKFANYLFAAQKKLGAPTTPESTHHLIEEAQLFIEASLSCYNRLGAVTVPAPR